MRKKQLARSTTNIYRPQRSCGKVMFSHAGRHPLPGQTPPLPTRADTLPPPADTAPRRPLCSGRYASYWNAFFVLLVAGKMVRDVKERFCIVASDSGSTGGSSSAKLYMMPDGKQAETIVYDWAKPAEILFNPALAGRYHSGRVGQTVRDTLQPCTGR